MKYISILIFLLGTVSLQAGKFFVAPNNGAMSHTGSEGSPWSTLDSVFSENKIESRKYAANPALPGSAFTVKNAGAPVGAGDTLVLMSGYHGRIDAREYYNTDYITILAGPDQEPAVSLFALTSACKWNISGLTISPSLGPVWENGIMLQLNSHNWTGRIWDCHVSDCRVFTVENSSNWVLEEWDTLACKGAEIWGVNNSIKNCHFKNISFGVMVYNDSCLIEGNIFENFSGDGMRTIGDYNIFKNNTVKNCYHVNDNHADGFQSWRNYGAVPEDTVEHIILTGNTFIAYSDTNQPFKGEVQGIGCFDGFYKGWRIENNVVYNDHIHGISFMGAINCTLVNNTVAATYTTISGKPGLRVYDHKNGDPSSGCIVINNLLTGLTADGQTVGNNLIIPSFESYGDYFINPENLDFRLLETSPAVDAGVVDLAPAVDRIGVVRPRGSGVDVGAYEYATESVVDFRMPIRDFPTGFNPGGEGVYDMKGRKVRPSRSWRIGTIATGIYIRFDGDEIVKMFLIR